MNIQRDSTIGWAWFTAFLALLAGLDQAVGGTPAFRDNLYYFMPQFEACRQAIAGDELPLWNPFMGCGHPLMATLQCAVASPLTLPFLVLPYVFAVKIFWVIIMLMAAGGMFSLARRAGLTPAGACLAGVLYSCAGPMRSLTEWPPIIQGMALLPLTLLAFDSLLRGMPGGVITAALFGSMQVFAGQPRQAVIAILACLIWWLAFRPGASGMVKRLLGAIMLAMLVSAVQFLPTLELFQYSERHAHGVPPSTVTESFLHIGDLFTLVLARFWGDEYRSFGPGRLLVPKLYIGWLGLWLAVSGAIYTKGRGHFFSLLAIIAGFALALGEPVYGILFRSATESHTLRYIGHMVIPAFVGIGLLAGGAFDRFTARTSQRKRGSPIVLVPALITLLILAMPFAPALLSLTGWPRDSAIYGNTLSAIRTNSLVGVLLIGLAWYLLMRFPRRTIVRISLPIIIAIYLLSAFHGYTFKVERDFYAEPDLLKVRGIRDGRLFDPASADQIYPDSSPITMRERYRGRWNIASPNIPQLFGLRNAHGYEPFRLESQRTLFGGWESGTSRVGDALRATGTRWAILPEYKRETGWAKRHALAGDWSLWEIPNPRALGEVIPSAAVIKDWKGLNSVAVAGTAKIREQGWNSLAGTVNAPKDSILLIRNSWYPGWKAFVNGNRVQVLRAGGVFMAVPLPSGQSPVQFIYSPASFRLGLFLSCIALMSALLSGLNALFSAHRRP